MVLTTFRPTVVNILLLVFSVSSLVAEAMSFRERYAANDEGLLGLSIAAGVSFAVIVFLLRDCGTRIEQAVLFLLAFEVIRKISTAVASSGYFPVAQIVLQGSRFVGAIDGFILLVFAIIFLKLNSNTLPADVK